ncbi:MAG: hypothetical protein Tsb0014_03340 [Pleurocapsa sp.]
MNNNNVVQLIQQGFHIALGATASCVETLQDPQKRAETFTEIQTELNQKTQEWSEKGAVTEAEAKAFVDDFLSQRGWKQTSNTNTTTTNSSKNGVYSGIEELTAEIMTLKLELEKLRQSRDS